MLTTLHEQTACLGHLRGWLESKIKLVPRWLIITVCINAWKICSFSRQESGRAENAAQAASWSMVELFWVSQCHRKDGGGYESVVLKLDMNLPVKI